MQVKKHLELDMEQQTGPKSGKEYFKAVYCHLAYLTYMKSTSWEMQGWMKHKLESRLAAETEEELKNLLMRVKEESGKSWLKTQHSKTENHGILHVK